MISNIKQDILYLKNKYVLNMMNKHTLNHLSMEFKSLFNKYDLNDFQYKLEYDVNNQTITLIPIKTIDKYVMYAIFK